MKESKKMEQFIYTILSSEDEGDNRLQYIGKRALIIFASIGFAILVIATVEVTINCLLMILCGTT